jgi:hypothetical protein
MKIAGPFFCPLLCSRPDHQICHADRGADDDRDHASVPAHVFIFFFLSRT